MPVYLPSNNNDDNIILYAYLSVDRSENIVGLRDTYRTELTHARALERNPTAVCSVCVSVSAAHAKRTHRRN